MSYLYRPFGLFFLFLMILLAFQVVLKKPLCIESSIVYKIDRISNENTESIYNCKQWKSVAFSPYFFESIDSLQTQISKAEMLLRALGISNQIVIVIDELADIMSAYPRELESAIVRLAQMSRAVGIH